MIKNAIDDFLKKESAGSILLISAAVIALIIKNSPLEGFYDIFLNLKLNISLGSFAIDKPLLLWINDGLMAVFFFLVGLELKRELIEGELSDKKNVVLPAMAAIGGMAVPALIYTFFNQNDSQALQGWAIPSATDIAFALGVLSVFGSRISLSVKLFLLAIAIIDDLGAILIIAVFYSGDLSSIALLISAIVILIMITLNNRKISSVSVYLFFGLILWIAVLKSGIHATVAGVITAFFIPLYDSKDKSISPLKNLEHNLHSAVAYIILPVFAFSNSGVSLSGITISDIFSPIPIGIASGLLIGKPLGILIFSWIAIKIKIASLPEGMNWNKITGIGFLCGIGFTMSLFIGSLAFENSGPEYSVAVRIGILIGSILSAIIGYIYLKYTR